MVKTMEISKGFQKTEVGIIPDDWEIIRIGDIFKFKNGLNKEKEFFWQGIPIVNYMDVYKNTGIKASNLTGKVTLSNQEIKNYEVRKGDVFFTRTSETVEEIGFASVVLEELNNTVFSGFVLRARPVISKIENIFCQFCFSSKEVRRQILTTASYTTRALTSGRLLSEVKIPLPPTKAEQTAIATALNDADALITQLEKIIAKKRNIKQGTMQELLRPKEGWEVKKLGDVFRFLNTANNARADLLESGEVEYIHYGDIHTRWNCFLDCSKNELPFIDKGKITGVPLLENGDLVIADASEDYEGLGACIEIKNIGKRKIVAGLHTLLLRGDKNIIAEGIRGYLRNFYGVKDTLIKLSTGVSVFGISKTSLKEVEFSIPPTVEEQTCIAQILSDMDAEIEALEKKLEKYKLLKQGMMQNLLTGKIRLV